MGFFNILGNILSGKPAEFKNNNEQKAVSERVKNTTTEPSEADSFGTPRDASGLKILPKVAIERVRCTIEDGHMECEAVIKNESEHRMELTRLILLGVDKNLQNAPGIDNFLDPEGERELIIYDGPAPSSDSLHDCELHYKNDSGDYFNAQHFVNFMVNQDGLYAVDTIEFVPPVRDIYE